MTTMQAVQEAIASGLEQPGRLRADALPEHFAYRDEGCDLFASCLACPLPRCRYDEPGGARLILSKVRDDEIRRMHEQRALGVAEIATMFRVSRRTVFRALEGPRKREASVMQACR